MGKGLYGCRGIKEPRSGALMRLLGGLEFNAQYVPGVFNNVADGISIWALREISSPYALISLGRSTTIGGTRSNSLCIPLGLGLIHNAIARSSKQTYQGHFGDW